MTTNLNNTEQFVQEAMDIAHNKEQSIFHQRNDFRELVETILDYQKEKMNEALRAQQKKDFDEEIHTPSPL